MPKAFDFIERVRGGEFSPAGAVHDALSRQVLHKKAVRPDLSAVHSDWDAWAATVRHDAFAAAWGARQLVKPATSLTDGILGTARPERDMAGAGGLRTWTYFAPVIVYGLGHVLGEVFVAPLTAPVARLRRLSYKDWEKQVSQLTGTAAFGVAMGPAVLLRDTAALVAAAPKVATTGLGLVAGATVGVIHGLVVARRQHHPLNDSTLLLLEPLDSVAPDKRFVSKDNCVFNIDELVACLAANGDFINPYTHAPFIRSDIERIIAHPSGAGEAVRAMHDVDEVTRGISGETIKQLGKLARTLASDTNARDGNPASSRALGEWEAYHGTLSLDDQDSIAAARPLASMRFTRMLADVMGGKECIHVFGGRLRRAVSELERDLPSQRKRLGIVRYFTT